MNDHKVYKITWDTGQYYYGYTARSPQERANEHRDKPVNAKMREAFRKDPSPQVRTVGSFSDETDARNHERELIDTHSQDNNCLNN